MGLDAIECVLVAAAETWKSERETYALWGRAMGLMET